MNETLHAAVVEHDPNLTVSDLLERRFAEAPNAVLFEKPTKSGGWSPVTTKEFRDEVIRLAKGFIAAGIKPGDSIALMSSVRYEWPLIDFAAFYAGAIVIPVYETSSPSQIEFVLKDAEAIAFILENDKMSERFKSVKGNLKAVKKTWRIDQGAVSDLKKLGAKVSDAEIEKTRQIAKAKDIATIIYTSGSTGKPKGCVLTHSNFVDTILNAVEEMSEVVRMKDASTLLFVTSAHVLARVIGILCVYSGVRVGHQADTSKLIPSLASFRPTFLLAVPRVFEKVYNSAEQKAEAAGKGAVFRRATNVAVAYSKALDHGKVPLGLRIKFKVFDTLVFKKLRKVMGGKVVYAISGSAPLGQRLGHYFRAIGIKVLEGYGLTETTGPVTVNVPHRFKIGTVGPALPGVSVKIAPNGEVLVKGVDVFKEYWKDPKSTKQALEKGWLHTGDLGFLDDDGYLTITGRVKEIIITAGGKNVAPSGLEDPVRSCPLVAQCIAVGEGKPFIAALITLDREMLPTWLQTKKLNPNMDVETAANHPIVLTEIQRAIDVANQNVSRAESIRKFKILNTDFTEASGHLTPKMSIKRDRITQDFHAEIESLYSNETETGALSLKG